jgi:monoamine oxidase
LAGLAAANYLLKQGISSIILEARDRVGGRICPDKTLGVTIGKGASWIHGVEGNPIVELFSTDKKEFYTYKRNLFYSYNRSCQRISEEISKNFDNQWNESLLIAKRFAQNNQHDIALSSALSHSINTHNLSLNEKDLLLKKIKYYENYLGDNYEYLSARHWDEEMVLPGEHGIVLDAYDGIIKSLVKKCNIQVNTTVQSIDSRGESIEIMTNKATYHAQFVIVTVPLGVLKLNKITFYPELPVEKKQAISKLGMGLFNIIAMRFPQVFWDDTCHGFFLPEKNTCATFFNASHFTKHPILLGYVGGDTARDLEIKSDSVIISDILKSFRKYFSKDVQSPETFFVTRWLDDPWSLGSYSYNAIGSSGEERDLLAKEIENRIYFAGEATHKDFFATTHGAYLSGVREAEKIVSRLMLT